MVGTVRLPIYFVLRLMLPSVHAQVRMQYSVLLPEVAVRKRPGSIANLERIRSRGYKLLRVVEDGLYDSALWGANEN